MLQSQDDAPSFSLGRLGLFPQAVQVGGIERREVQALILRHGLDAPEAALELSRRRAQGVFTVDAQVASQGAQGEEQIAHLVVPLGRAGRGLQLGDLLAHLGQYVIHARPVEAQLGRLTPHGLGQAQRR